MSSKKPLAGEGVAKGGPSKGKAKVISKSKAKIASKSKAKSKAKIASKAGVITDPFFDEPKLIVAHMGSLSSFLSRKLDGLGTPLGILQFLREYNSHWFYISPSLVVCKDVLESHPIRYEVLRDGQMVHMMGTEIRDICEQEGWPVPEFVDDDDN